MPNQQNPGCLPSILRLFGIEPKPTRTPLKVEVVESEVSLEDLPYRVRDDFLSPTEISFYHVLRTVLNGRALICPKVGLGEIFFVTRPHENFSFRGRIVQKHLDFLLCDPQTLHPLLGIELDDASHAHPDRQARDEFVNKAFEAANLPLLHFPAKRTYNTRELAEELAKYLEPLSPQPAAGSDEARQEPPRQEAAHDAPFCPSCGERMVVCTVTKGDYQGRQFYGCPNYPRCRKRLPLNR